MTILIALCGKCGALAPPAPVNLRNEPATRSQLLGQPGGGHGSEENARAAGLFGVGVVEDGPERLAVDLHGAGESRAADGAARVVELHRMLKVPRLAVVARDDEVDLLAADTRTDDLRGQQPAVLQGDQLVAPALG